MINPAIIPITIFTPKICKITFTSTAFEIKIGNISSDVDKKIAINVPKEITLPAYNPAADAEKPHCGTAPKIPPNKGPNFPDLCIMFFTLSLVLCSINSINKYVKNKNGTNFNVSMKLCSKTCKIPCIIKPPLQLQIIRN